MTNIDTTQIITAEDKRKALLNALLAAIDTKTDAVIVSGWIYPDDDGQQVRLTPLDQANYEGEKNLYAELAYDGVDVSGYFPVEVKVWTGSAGEPIMLSMATLAAYKDFVRAGKGYIRAELNAGWALKNQLITMTLEELQSWEDPQ